MLVDAFNLPEGTQRTEEATSIQKIRSRRSRTVAKRLKLNPRLKTYEKKQ